MLTDTEIKKAKAGVTPKKLSDGGGLFLLITVGGSKLWRPAYRFNGKQNTLCIGEYPTFFYWKPELSEKKPKGSYSTV